MPLIGPGRGSNSTDKSGGHEDFGLEQITGDPADILKFRTPSLRNVNLTAPYGHAGAYNSLHAVVEHHLDSVNTLFSYDLNQTLLPSRADLDCLDAITMNDSERVEFIAQRTRSHEIHRVRGGTDNRIFTCSDRFERYRST